MRHQWDLLSLAEWLAVEGGRFTTSALPEEPRDGESLAEALERLYRRDDASFANEAELDAWYDRLYEFRSTHSSLFALSGASVPEVIVGLNHGNAEVSRSAGERWAYRIEIERLKADFIEDILEITESSSARSGPPEVRDRVAAVRSKVKACSQSF